MMFSILVLFPSMLSAELSNFQYEIIQIAFLNGYVNALEPDIETIKELKEHENELKKQSKIAAMRYMKDVFALSMPNKKIDKKPKKHSAFYQHPPWY